jgi:ribonuclease III
MKVLFVKNAKSSTQESLEQSLGYRFHRADLLTLALTHSSWGHEKKQRLPHNERMEFLGDAVLQLVISDYLFKQNPDLPEGRLTKIRSHLVSRAGLLVMAKSLDLGSYILLGESEQKHGGRERASNLANAMEAILGAIFLDSGYEAAYQVATKLISLRLGEIQDHPEPANAKGILQEKLHTIGKKATYHIVSEKGPAHQKEFHATVEIDGETFGEGKGNTKKVAETEAAIIALQRLQESSAPDNPENP